MPAPNVPAAGEHIWDWFWSLHGGRRAGFGPEPLAYSEIAAWCALTGARPMPDEVRIIKAMDAAYLDEHGKIRT